MSHTLLYTVVFIITLLILVTIHEWGHFWVARRFGVKVLRFSFGFGKPLWRHMGRDGTEYVFSLLPLGGYVTLLDGREMPLLPAEKHQAFDTQPVLVRMAILFAGSMMNIILGFIAFAGVFMIGIERAVPVIGEVPLSSIAAQAHLPAGAQIKTVDYQPVDSWQKIGIALVSRLGDSGYLMLGVIRPDTLTPQTFALPLTHWSLDALYPDPFKSLGIVPYHPPMPVVISVLKPNSPAAIAGLQVGDHFLSINARLVKDWPDLVAYVKTLSGETVPVEIERDGKRMTVHMTLEKHLFSFSWREKMGIGIDSPQWPTDKRALFQLPPLPALKEAAVEVWRITKFHGVVLEKIIQGKISVLSIGGPITIFETSGMAFQQGMAVYISFLGLISVMLACINLLPIPGLDGGQLLFCLLEVIIRRPIPLRWQLLFLRLGMAALILLMVQATVNDIVRFFL